MASKSLPALIFHDYIQIILIRKFFYPFKCFACSEDPPVQSLEPGTMVLTGGWLLLPNHGLGYTLSNLNQPGFLEVHKNHSSPEPSIC